MPQMPLGLLLHKIQLVEVQTVQELVFPMVHPWSSQYSCKNPTFTSPQPFLSWFITNLTAVNYQLQRVITQLIPGGPPCMLIRPYKRFASLMALSRWKSVIFEFTNQLEPLPSITIVIASLSTNHQLTLEGKHHCCLQPRGTILKTQKPELYNHHYNHHYHNNNHHYNPIILITLHEPSIILVQAPLSSSNHQRPVSGPAIDKGDVKDGEGLRLLLLVVPRCATRLFCSSCSSFQPPNRCQVQQGGFHKAEFGRELAQLMD